ncbi:type VI secretion system baseplate subunit TssK [Acinetobacter apis]|uniref:Type VI secretion system protein ImpJ n=1 Tax=Acinetobacter apis TaxID=1229165 RepID=A0A217EHY0_9GAMM|nr:type VI secretion system baseplate subunit TssK [Acinetobacter apis]SNQ29964.1 type VI secretion system protein ImpJ [Acinetobacter apis]
MFTAEKILWGEGLFLRPQHFQAQDHYHEQHLNQTIRSLIPFAYGIKKIRFDQNQLNLNVLALEHIEMIWQDGDIYNAPASDLLPAPIMLNDLQLKGEMNIYLALPIVQPNKKNVVYDQHTQPGRYHSVSQEAHDLFTDAVPAEITLLRRQAQFKLLDPHSLPNEEFDGFLYVPVGKLNRDSSGFFEFDHQFIPPILHIKSNDALIQNLKRTLNIIKAKIKTIQNNNRENEQKLVEFRSGDIVSFWLVNALNASYATLNHLFLNAEVHPERLYCEFLRLIGSLLTFTTAYEVDQLPTYQHLQLKQCFGDLDTIVRDLLDTIISHRYISIALKETRPSYWVGHLESDKITKDSRLYVAISSSMIQTHELIQIVPIRFKVGSTVDVEQRVMAALPAVPLHHLMQVPAAIPVRSGVSYFEIEPNDELYKKMLDSESICIYVPSGFQDVSIELIAVLN